MGNHVMLFLTGFSSVRAEGFILLSGLLLALMLKQRGLGGQRVHALDLIRRSFLCPWSRIYLILCGVSPRNLVERMDCVVWTQLPLASCAVSVNSRHQLGLTCTASMTVCLNQ